MELRIDPEFKNKIPPLTEDEFKQLEENIVNDGEVYEPIAVWNGVIVDGHNRWLIIQKHPEIPYRIREMGFADKWEAFDWMYKKQLGRRNLTDEQRTVLIGKMYEARKRSRGGVRGNQYVKVANTQNGGLAKPKTTAEAIAREIGVGENTVVRAEQFSKGIDALEAISHEAAEKVLSGKSGATKILIQNLPNADSESVKEVATMILDGEIRKRNMPGLTDWKQARKTSAKIDEVSEILSMNRKNTYSLDDALAEMKVLEQEFMDKAKRVLQIRQTVINGDKKMADLIDQIANNIKTLKEEL